MFRLGNLWLGAAERASPSQVTESHRAEASLYGRFFLRTLHSAQQQSVLTFVEHDKHAHCADARSRYGLDVLGCETCCQRQPHSLLQQPPIVSWLTMASFL